jgi:lysophospholipase L1-like esterase
MRTNPHAKRVLIYGDSLVRGKMPCAWSDRHDVVTRFSWLTQNILWDDYDIIEEWQRWRMLARDNAYFPYRNGKDQFWPIFSSHVPLDLVVIMLGTNDMNRGQDETFEEMRDAFKAYIETIQRWSTHFGIQEPKILVVCPPVIDEEPSYPIFKDIFKGASAKSRMLSEWYARIAQEFSLAYLDVSKLVAPSPIDGIHLDEENNAILAKLLATKIQDLI